MSLPVAILIAVAIAAAVFAAIVALAARLDPPQRGRHVPFADPADRTDPDGEKYAAWAASAAAEAWRPDPGPLAELVRALPAAGPLPELPPDPPPDATGVLPPAEAYLGTPIDQYVDELFSKHAEAQQ